MYDELFKQLLLYSPAVLVLMIHSYQQQAHVDKLIDKCINKDCDCKEKKDGN